MDGDSGQRPCLLHRDTGRSRHAQRDQTKVHGTPVHAWRRYEVQVRAHSMPGVIVYPAEEAALDLH